MKRKEKKRYVVPFTMAVGIEVAQLIAASGGIDKRPDYGRDDTGWDQSDIGGRNNYSAGSSDDWDQDD